MADPGFGDGGDFVDHQVATNFQAVSLLSLTSLIDLGIGPLWLKQERLKMGLMQKEAAELLGSILGPF